MAEDHQPYLEHAETDLKTMSRYLQSLSPEQIDATNINQYFRNQKIISLTEAEYPDFARGIEALPSSICVRSTAAGKMESSVPAGYSSGSTFLCFIQWMDAGISSCIPTLLRKYPHLLSDAETFYGQSPGNDLKKPLDKALHGNCDVRTPGTMVNWK